MGSGKDKGVGGTGLGVVMGVCRCRRGGGR